jgi:hypothetical protein
MSDDGDTQTNEGDTTGKENTVVTKKPEENSNEPTPLQEADRINKEKAVLLDREEKLQKRKEDLVAIQQVGGHTVGGKTEKKKELTPKEYRAKVNKDLAEGKYN